MNDHNNREEKKEPKKEEKEHETIQQTIKGDISRLKHSVVSKWEAVARKIEYDHTKAKLDDKRRDNIQLVQRFNQDKQIFEDIEMKLRAKIELYLFIYDLNLTY